MEGANWQAECRMLDLCDLWKPSVFLQKPFTKSGITAFKSIIQSVSWEYVTAAIICGMGQHHLSRWIRLLRLAVVPEAKDRANIEYKAFRCLFSQ